MLLILKIIGIILICILGMVLFAVLCALFVPLRYQIEVMREEGEGKPPVVVRVKVTWLLHLINVLLRYPADEPRKEKTILNNKRTSGEITIPDLKLYYRAIV